MTTPCATPLSLGTLIAYRLGELDGSAERQAEDHFFECAYCAGNLEELSALESEIRSVFASGTISAVISPAFLAWMKERGMRVRDYSVSPGGTLNCTITAQDDAVVAKIKAPLSEVSRLDVLRIDRSGNIRLRLNDVPFDPAAGEVLLCPSAAALKATPAASDTMRLLAVGVDGDERLLAEYVFNHTSG